MMKMQLIRRAHIGGGTGEGGGTVQSVTGVHE